MKKLNSKILKTLFLAFCFLTSIVSSLNLFPILSNNQKNIIPLDKDQIPNSFNSPNEFIYTLNGRKYIAENITKEIVMDKKIRIDFYQQFSISVLD
ncbi:MAG: hypothetical protein KGD57_06365 [Candidatus Lokiarchaeota archaeon]|nr:hypothetical protein [Candidatus Lokiarchaeota archaeon]